MNQKSIFDFKTVILPTIFEYFVILLPVAFYIGIESLHEGAKYLLISPEWAIASIFLTFQSIFIYYKHLIGDNKRINYYFFGILILLLIVITLVSALNAYSSLHETHNTIGKIVLRLSILLISSITFFILVIAAKQK